MYLKTSPYFRIPLLVKQLLRSGHAVLCHNMFALFPTPKIFVFAGGGLSVGPSSMHSFAVVLFFGRPLFRDIFEPTNCVKTSVKL